MRRDLMHGGYNVPSKADRADLIELCKRMWRDLPDYTQCTSNQLRKFNLDRRLITQAEYDDNHLHPKQLIRNLKAADENPTFTKFLDLPPELRCKIYDCYTKDFPITLRHPTQPPLARIHPIIRTELLPIFYCSATFKIELLEVQKNDSRPKRLHFDKSSYAWLNNLSDASIAEMHDWELRIDNWQWGFDIHFSGDAKETRVESYRCEHHHRSEAKKIVKAIEEVLHEVSQREGKLKLKREDLYAIRRILEEIAYPASQ
ncbi:hypothetical protein HII31_11147 [Pseudocercospora fuligena]|uniref:Uncharacterized protein n=1 Tax=Pseudocercospora fuligena TaxID=685502 RepID=A0A8H6RAM5_9PEZI|nr:hypothetical protein HII31_11147 [Pseudocercospora fuligena]